jgi:hypothetical protein
VVALQGIQRWMQHIERSLHVIRISFRALPVTQRTHFSPEIEVCQRPAAMRFVDAVMFSLLLGLTHGWHRRFFRLEQTSSFQVKIQVISQRNYAKRF